MEVSAVITGEILIAQFDDRGDAEMFVALYACPEVPMYITDQQEDFERTVFTYLPEEAFCIELIAYKTGVKL